MLLQIERQKNSIGHSDLAAYNVDSRRTVNTRKSIDKGKFTVDKRNLVCDYCKRKGHSKESCLKLHGVSE